MKISFVTNQADLSNKGGYHTAGLGIVTSLQELGHSTPWNSSDAPVQLNFCFPEVFADSLRSDQHQIWLAVFESTKLKPHWYEIVDEVDEIWTASDWYKEVLENDGYNVSKIYRHGVGPEYKPLRRTVRDKVRFLFDGGASRKNPQMVFNAFKAAFGNSTDVELIMKEKYVSTVREYQGQNIIGTPGGNVKIVTKVYEDEQMVQLFHYAHCYVSAVSGDGFGLPQQQALATGIPAIATEECAPYRQFLGNLGLKSEYVDSPWLEMHPGQVLQPSFDDLVDKYRYVYENIDTLLVEYYKQAFKVHDWADWNTLTHDAFDPIVKRYA